MQPPSPELENDPLLGTTLGSFRLVKRIGHGGMGAVYLGEQTVIGSRVAVKVLHEHLASDPSLVARFYAEARAVNLIVHPNIVNIFDMAVVPPRRFYLVMEYLEGEPLSAVAQGPMPARTAIPILTQVCQALAAAHSHGVLHRDLKPENVFLCRREGPVPFVKILDFGIAKLFGSDAPTGQTTAGFIVGTPEYMAPEQATGAPLDGRADLYALGVIAYRMATGRLPFSGGGVTGVLLAHRDRPPRPPREVVPGVPVAWSNAILRALAKRPEDRFQSAEEFRNVLEAVLVTLGKEGARPGRAAAPVPSDAEAPTVLAAGGAPTPPPRTPAPGTPAPLSSPLPRHVSPPPGASPLPSRPSPPPGVASPPPGPGAPGNFAGTVVLPGGTPAAVSMRDLSRGGLFICLDEALPPAFTRLKLSLQAPPGEMAEAEVVRQVTPEQASAWGMAPGVGVQFVSPSRAFKEALARRMEGRPPAHAGDAPPPAGRPDALAEKALARWRTRLAENPYTLLGCSPESEFPDIRARARAVRAQLDELAGRALATSQERELEKVRRRLEEAAEAISTPVRRAETDAELGNWRGVARCIAAGLTVSDLETRRERFLKTHPGADTRAHVHRVAGKAWEGKSAMPQAVEEYERGLELDPLNLGLHQAYWAIKRKTAHPEGSRA
ncbi:MAG TPA: serine/threonine-protein kinase [Myxococcaceae bacterium]|nr:serine/threonine-protein kinase [Myxococcaceae bacterium]